MGGTEGWPSAWLLPGVGSGPRNAMVGPPGTPYPTHYLRASCPHTHQPRPGLAFLAPENAPGRQISRASGVPAVGQGENEDSSIMDSCPPETTSWLLLSPASLSLSVLICNVFCPPPSALTCLSHLSGQLSPSCFSVPLSPFFPPSPSPFSLLEFLGLCPSPYCRPRHSGQRSAGPTAFRKATWERGLLLEAGTSVQTLEEQRKTARKGHTESPAGLVVLA